MNGKRILIEIGHPAHVHHFRHMYWELEKEGWTGLFVTKDKECAIELLKAYDLPYQVLGVNKKGIARKILSLPMFSLKMINIARAFKPDIFVSRVSPLSGYASFILRKPHITFTDTENVKLLDSISQPFADVVCTSDVYLRDHGKKQIRYPGYHELAYLHPNRFVKDTSILSDLGIDHKQRFALVRFVTWGAHHDIGHSGFSTSNKIKLVNELSKHLRVFISSEGEIPQELMRYKLDIPAQHIHQVLAQAHMFVGESATMASECAVLGTPAIFINSNRFGSTDDQASYGLLSQFSESELDQKKAIKQAVVFATDDELKFKTAEKRIRMLNNKIDVTSFLTWFIETYPRSAAQARQVDFDFSQFKR
jgi:predicted glycosyltransferase